MNQEIIGKFISQRRKDLKLKQKDLADKLHISEKTISKWECGKGLPEVSLMQPLCKELNISVNELLNGESDNKEEEAIVEYVKYEKKKSNKDVQNVEVCNECHPFYTGKQGAAKKSSNIDKFNKKFNLESK